MSFRDPDDFAFVPGLEAAFEDVVTEVRALALDPDAFVASPDSLTTVAGGYDESGWRSFALFEDGDEVRLAANRRRCPRTAAACAAVPRMVNASLSLFRPGTHLFPHRGELAGVLRCHLALIVPEGDVGLRLGGETRRWEPGRCLLFDDTVEHEAWNHGAGDRVVLIVSVRSADQGGRDR